MVTVKKEGVLLRTTDLAFENEGVLNPATYRDGNVIHMFYRAVRQGNYSTIGYCKLNGPLTVAERSAKPVLDMKMDYESHGVEDPRIVKIDSVYYLSYIAYDSKDALGCVATSTDLVNFERQGIIVPQIPYDQFMKLISHNQNLANEYKDNYNVVNTVVMDKDVVFFPRRVNGQLVFMHRIKPGIQITMVNELTDLTPEFWNDYIAHLDEHILLSPRYDHDILYIGAGCPPVETEAGWVMIHHGVKNGEKGYEYSACAMLMDLHDPRKVLGRLPYPLFKPGEPWELSGDVDDVVFPTGTALFDDTLYVYYGAADDLIAVASLSLKELVQELLNNPV